MVYLGVSKGCRTCRNRKVKCDQGKPECQRCKKSKRPCLGYEAIAFRDQNKLVEQKARNGRERCTAQPILIRSRDEDVAVAETPAPMPCLPQSAEEDSLCFFMNHLVIYQRHEATAGGPVEFLPRLYASAPARSALSAATLAVAMGRAAWYPGRSHYRLASIAKYAEAIGLVNEAIQDGEASKSDHVLQAVLMLGLWQGVRAVKVTRPEHDAHIKGASALLRNRGVESFGSETSSKLFLAVRAQLVQNCIRNEDCTPLVELMSFTGDIHHRGNNRLKFGDRLAMLTSIVPSLVSRAKTLRSTPKTATKYQKTLRLMQDAKRDDLLFTDLWIAEAPAEFHYTSVALHGSNEYANNVYPRTLDSYHDVFVANEWNLWRTSRIHILTVVKQCAVMCEDVAEVVEADATIQQLIDDVCSSVPFQLGYEKSTAQEQPAYPHVAGCATWLEAFGLPYTLGGFLLIQPLGIAVKVDCIPETQRQWMRAYLAILNKDPRELDKEPLKVGLP